jgi:GT2 family glycosyltransferase
MISVVIISKDEASLDNTLTEVTSQVTSLAEHGEIVVVDSSSGRLDYIRKRHEATVRWVDFQPLLGIRVSIPHQRNVGVREAHGDIIVFTDAGCRPSAGWLTRMVALLRQDEYVAGGFSKYMSGAGRYTHSSKKLQGVRYLRESATLNFAFRRAVFDVVGGFDESFAYGSDVDFCWRINDSGFQIRLVHDAIVYHDWGTRRRQRRRSYMYGKARARLYRKHRARRKHILRNDPIVIVYPLFLLGLPLTLIFPLYPLLLLIPAWRNRSSGVMQVLVDHLFFGAGVLAELAGL